LHTKSGNCRLYYGPLLLRHEGIPDPDIPKIAVIVKTDKNSFQIKGTDIVLSTVYHLMDPGVSQSAGYRKQILFRQTTN